MTQISLERGGHFINQVAENFPGGKLSCALATQLNANVALGLLDTLTAVELQDELCHDPKFDEHWSDSCDSTRNPLGRAWKLSPIQLSEVAQEHFGIELTDAVHPIFAGVNFYDVAFEKLHRELRTGAVAYVAGRSVVASHARLAFIPEELPRKVYVHDPNYIDTTSLYDALDIEQFFLRAAWVFRTPNSANG